MIGTGYILKSVPPAKAHYTPYGGALDFYYATAPEVIISGPAETGKTLAGMWKVHTLAMKYPGCNGAIVRKIQSSIYGSVLQTYQRVIKGAPVVAYGGERPEKYIYSNGSVIWIAGMDNPDKLLSSERDFVYVNQAEELTVDDWEKLTTRVTGRGAIIRYPQLMGDCNPGGSRHWIRDRSRESKLRLIISRHTDNPTLFNPTTGEITPQGVRTMNALDSLTGVRRKRLKDGIWATAEGAVYDTFDATIHVTKRPFTDFQRWGIGMDEGYTNPAVALLVGVDGDGRVHIAREFYKRGVLQEKVVETVKGWCDDVRQQSIEHLIAQGVTDPLEYEKLAASIEVIAVDSSAAGLIADLVSWNLPAVGARGRVIDGITTVQQLLAVNGDGRPRMTVDPDCVETINEFESYAWKPEKDEPIKLYDHAMDGARYLVPFLVQPMVITTENPFYDN